MIEPSENEIDDVVNRAFHYGDRQRYDEPERIVREALESDPQNVDLLSAAQNKVPRDLTDEPKGS